MLQCVAVCCSVLQCDAMRCSVVQCIVVWCSVMQCAAVCYSVLQCVAVCCSVLQCVAVCCSVLQCVAVVLQLMLPMGGSIGVPPKDGEIALQTPQTEFWVVRQYVYHTNDRPKMNLLILLVR